MNRIQFSSLVVSLFMFAILSCKGQEQNIDKEEIMGEETIHKSDKTKGIVLVELFTSQGCSSCPPADKVLKEVAEKYSNEEVLPLSFHVDYWDRLGWKDPFSSKENTNRQKKYAYNFRLSSIYTPQIVINGEYETVGSRKSEVNQVIQKVKKVSVLDSSLLEVQEKNVTLNVPTKYQNENNKVLLFKVLKETENDVISGENRNRKLTHSNVVIDVQEQNSTDSINFSIQKDTNHFYVLLIENEQQKPLAVTSF